MAPHCQPVSPLCSFCLSHPSSTDILKKYSSTRLSERLSVCRLKIGKSSKYAAVLFVFSHLIIDALDVQQKMRTLSKKHFDYSVPMKSQASEAWSDYENEVGTMHQLWLGLSDITQHEDMHRGTRFSVHTGARHSTEIYQVVLIHCYMCRTQAYCQKEGKYSSSIPLHISDFKLVTGFRYHKAPSSKYQRKPTTP